MKSEFFFFQIIKIYFFPYLFTQSDLIIVQFIPDNTSLHNRNNLKNSIAHQIAFRLLNFGKFLSI